MDGWKSWLTSKGVWGGLLTVIQVGLQMIGYQVDPAFHETALNLGLSIGELVTGALAVYGRVVASKSLIKKA